MDERISNEPASNIFIRHRYLKNKHMYIHIYIYITFLKRFQIVARSG